MSTENTNTAPVTATPKQKGRKPSLSRLLDNYLSKVNGKGVIVSSRLTRAEYTNAITKLQARLDALPPEPVAPVAPVAQPVAVPAVAETTATVAQATA